MQEAISYAIIFTGEAGPKNFQGKKVEVTPFIGCPIGDADHLDQGIGLLLPEGKAIFCGGAKTKSAEILWRGMKLLEQVPGVNDGVLHACLKGGNPKVTPGHHSFIPTYTLYGGYQEFNRVRREVLLMTPDRVVIGRIERGIRQAHFMSPIASALVAISSEHFMGNMAEA